MSSSVSSLLRVLESLPVDDLSFEAVFPWYSKYASVRSMRGWGAQVHRLEFIAMSSTYYVGLFVGVEEWRIHDCMYCSSEVSIVMSNNIMCIVEVFNVDLSQTL